MTKGRVASESDSDGKETIGGSALSLVDCVRDALLMAGHAVTAPSAVDTWLCASSALVPWPVDAEGASYWPAPCALPRPPESAAHALAWLEERLGAVSSALSPSELLSSVLATLAKEGADAALVDLLGFENVELAGEIIARTSLLLEARESAGRASRPARPRGETHAISGHRGGPQHVAPDIASVHAALREGVSRGIRAADAQGALPHVYGVAQAALQPPSLDGKVAMPAGTEHRDRADCEEFVLPATRRAEGAGDGIRIVEVSEMPAPIRAAFGGYTRLNRMQSAVYAAAAEARENMLVCAPTGAGKTDVAVLALARAAADAGPGRLRAVYVAPMKALAAEVAAKLGRRLRPLGLAVREYTGDMQLSRAEAAATHVLVTTPEKWDVAGRQAPGDAALAARVRLLIIDEVHLLQDDRGAVLEAIVARTLRAVERTQRRVRIVGLSATLPNYADVASFLRVDPAHGLYVFGDAFRPVPLTQHLVGVKGRSAATLAENTDAVLYDRCRGFLRDTHQVMVFVHARGDTARTARTLLRLAADDARSGRTATETPGGTVEPRESLPNGRSEPFGGQKSVRGRGGKRGERRTADARGGGAGGIDPKPTEGNRDGPSATTNVRSGEDIFLPPEGMFSEAQRGAVAAEVGRARSPDLRALVRLGLAVHHAGMVRSDRALVERLFEQGHVRVLVCTSTLAWGVNLPAHAVVIKGTRVWDAERGAYADLSVLDVLQIFGRAGRPQYDTAGVGVLLATHEALPRYVAALLCQRPIESHMLAAAGRLEDTLNAEVALGTVASADDAVRWLRYTYLCVRMRRNPQAYGLSVRDVARDPLLDGALAAVARRALERLAAAAMVALSSDGAVAPRDVGRIASTHYLSVATVEAWGAALRPGLGADALLALVAGASEFSRLRVRDDEAEELEFFADASVSPLLRPADVSSAAGKAALLLQAYVSRVAPDAPSLASDAHFVAQSAGRVARALFEVVRSARWTSAALAALELCKCWERRAWRTSGHALWQTGRLSRETAERLLAAGSPTPAAIRRMGAATLAALGGGVRGGELLARLAASFPTADVRVSASFAAPVVLRLAVRVEPTYRVGEAPGDPGASGAARTHDHWWLVADDPAQQTFLACVPLAVVAGAGAVGVVLHVDAAALGARRLRVRAISDAWLHAEECVLLEDISSLSPLRTDGAVLFPEAPANASVGDAYVPGRYSVLPPALRALAAAVHGADGSAVLGLCAGVPCAERVLVAELALWRAVALGRPCPRVVYACATRNEALGVLALVAPVLRASNVHVCGSAMGHSWSDINQSLSAIGHSGSAIGQSGGTIGQSESAIGQSESVKRHSSAADSHSSAAAVLAVVAHEDLAHMDVAGVAVIVVDALQRASALGEAAVGRVSMLVALATAEASGGTETLSGAANRASAECGAGLHTAPTRMLVMVEGTDDRSLQDVARWLRLPAALGTRPEMRASPLRVRIESFGHRSRDARRAAMVRPAYAAASLMLAGASDQRPNDGAKTRAIVVVPSARMARMLAEGFVSLACNDGDPHRFVRGDHGLAGYVEACSDDALRSSLAFGVAIAHTGMRGAEVAYAAFAHSGAAAVLIATPDAVMGRADVSAPLVVLAGLDGAAGSPDAEWVAGVCAHSDAPTDPRGATDDARPSTATGSLDHCFALALRALCTRAESDVVALVSEECRTLTRHALTAPAWPVESRLRAPLSLADALLSSCALSAPKTSRRVIPPATEMLRTAPPSIGLLARRASSNPTLYGALDASGPRVDEALLAMLADARALLVRLGAVSASGELTPPGLVASLVSLRPAESADASSAAAILCALKGLGPEETPATLRALAGDSARVLFAAAAIAALHGWETTFSATLKLNLHSPGGDRGRASQRAVSIGVSDGRVCVRSDTLVLAVATGRGDGGAERVLAADIGFCSVDLPGQAAVVRAYACPSLCVAASRSISKARG